MKEKPFFSWRQAVLDTDLEANTKLVLLVLSTFMNDHGTGCYPSMDTIAAKSGLSKRSVITHIQNAVEAGFIVVKQHGFKGREWRTNDYRIAFPKAERGATAAPASAEEKPRAGVKRGATLSPRQPENAVQPFHHANSEAGATAAPRQPDDVVQMVQGRGANGDIGVVNQLHSNSPMNSPMNSPVPPTVVVGGNATQKTLGNSHQLGASFRMFAEWCPREHFVDMLLAAGLPANHDWEPDWKDFVLYWQHNPNCPSLNQSQWESKFRTAVLHNHRHAVSQPTPLPVDWHPSVDCFEQLRIEGYDTVHLELDVLPAFTLYWRDDGTPQRSWNTKFIEWVRRNAKGAAS